MTERPARWLHALPVLVAAGATFALLRTSPAPAAAPASALRQGAQPELGEQLYLTQCASCHGVDGTGVEGRGPTLTVEGPAAVDFVLRTGRMPLADPDMQARRRPVRYTEEEIQALVAYAGAFGNGPDIPDVDPSAGDLALGGELYRLNCAACHVASGAGAAIGGSREAPELTEATPTEIGQAILIGPGAMPSFGTFTERDIDSVARYIQYLQEQGATSVSEFGGAGPVAEGLAAWLLGLVPLIALTRWIGTPHEGRDTAAVAAADTTELDAGGGAPGGRQGAGDTATAQEADEGWGRSPRGSTS